MNTNQDRDLERKTVIRHLRDNGVLPESQLIEVERKLEAADKIVDEFAAEYERHKQRGLLTAAGLQERRAELSQQYQGRLQFLQDSVTGLDANIASKMASMEPKREEGDRTLQFMAEMEIRQHLRTLDPLELQAQYLEWCTDGSDDSAAQALESAPKIFGLLTAEVIAKGRKLRAARKFPAVAEEIDRLQLLRSLYHNALTSARKSLK